MKRKPVKGRSQPPAAAVDKGKLFADIARLNDPSRPIFELACEGEELRKIFAKNKEFCEAMAQLMPPAPAKTPEARPAPPVPPKRQRKQGGGRKPKFTEARADELQAIYRRALAKDARLREPRFAIPHMGKSLTRAEREISETTLKRSVLRPVLREQNKRTGRAK